MTDGMNRGAQDFLVIRRWHSLSTPLSTQHTYFHDSSLLCRSCDTAFICFDDFRDHHDITSNKNDVKGTDEHPIRF